MYERYITEHNGKIYTVNSTSHHVFKVEGCHLEFVRTLNQEYTNFNFHHIDGLYISQLSPDYEGGFDLYYLDEEQGSFIDVVIPTQMSGKLRGEIFEDKLIVFSNANRKVEFYTISDGELTFVSSKTLDLEAGLGILYPNFDIAFGDIYFQTPYYNEGESFTSGDNYKWDLNTDILTVIDTYNIYGYKNGLGLKVDGNIRLSIHGVDKVLTQEESELVGYAGLRTYKISNDVYVSSGCTDSLYLFTETGFTPVSLSEIIGCDASYLVQSSNGIIAFDVIEVQPEEVKLIVYEVR